MVESNPICELIRNIQWVEEFFLTDREVVVFAVVNTKEDLIEELMKFISKFTGVDSNSITIIDNILPFL